MERESTAKLSTTKPVGPDAEPGLTANLSDAFLAMSLGLFCAGHVLAESDRTEGGAESHATSPSQSTDGGGID